MSNGGLTLGAYKTINSMDILSDGAQGTVGEPGVSTSHFKLDTLVIDSIQSHSSFWRSRRAWWQPEGEGAHQVVEDHAC